MKKEQEEEAAKRVAEERNKRAVNDQKSASNGHDKVKQQEIPFVPKQQPIREPSPPPIPRPETPPPAPQIFSPSIYENIGNQFETQRSITNEEKKEETTKLVGGINVSSLLRQRKTSSSSSKNEDEDEWNVDRKSYNQRRSPSPTPIIHSEQLSNNNEGIRCIARYSYQKSRQIKSF
jgi:hypothetical protein